MIHVAHRFGRYTWFRFCRAIGLFLGSPDGPKAWLMLGLLIAFLVIINGLNVIHTYVGRDFMSAIEHRDHAGFLRMAWIFVGVFALSTVAAVVFRYLEERLGLLWRNWQTRQVLELYLDRQAYYRLEEEGELPNPDQRISEDIRTFTTSTLSFVLMMLNASITVLAFSGVLWSISPRLFVIAVLYAIAGSTLTVLVGKRLIGLSSRQLDMEANFRSELLTVRENASSIALLHREPHLHRRLLTRLDDLVLNTRQMISINRRLGFYTNGYNYLIQLIPALIVAPMFMDGSVSFGVITQSAMAFAALMGAFSLAVTQFQSISSYAAVLGRLENLVAAMERAIAPSESPIEVIERDGELRYEHLTLRRSDGRPLIHDFNLAVQPGQRLLLTGVFGEAKIALFRATAGLACPGEGRIIRPDGRSILFVPERPYLPRGTLRELLLRADDRGPPRDVEMLEMLHMLQLDAVLERAGGLDIEHDWSNLLNLGEQAGVVVARVLLARPQFVFFDRMNMALNADRTRHVLGALTASGIAYLVLGRVDEPMLEFDATIDFAADGSWVQRQLHGALDPLATA